MPLDEKDEYVGTWSKLHLFLLDGRTLTFNKVSDFEENETTIKFDYKAASDEYVKSARFKVSAILGYSFLEA